MKSESEMKKNRTKVKQKQPLKGEKKNFESFSSQQQCTFKKESESNKTLIFLYLIVLETEPWPCVFISYYKKKITNDSYNAVIFLMQITCLFVFAQLKFR